jgi:hypothetical protein
MTMSDKPISEMTEEEILAEVAMLRERRAAARERKVAPQAAAIRTKSSTEIGGSLGNLLDEILKDQT